MGQGGCVEELKFLGKFTFFFFFLGGGLGGRVRVGGRSGWM